MHPNGTKSNQIKSNQYGVALAVGRPKPDAKSSVPEDCGGNGALAATAGLVYDGLVLVLVVVVVYFSGGGASSGANSTVKVEPGPKPLGTTMALILPSGACT